VPSPSLAQEDRVRRMAEGRGLSLRKSRRRDPQAYGYGLYWIADPYRNALVSDESGMSLDEAERWLTDVIATDRPTDRRSSHDRRSSRDRRSSPPGARRLPALSQH